ncbi:hypothetical protein PsorP6_004570 [Peronosclerospora sorghi]|uniref:Uncharacterized protein n=1 Tax=Peronosclerospora sorghi TaxID=230839 RepID=A0ACC0VIC4_9STRA|nr:hypothetical protein PsorP6_004570 [Peronosclerospora sorghi]
MPIHTMSNVTLHFLNRMKFSMFHKLKSSVKVVLILITPILSDEWDPKITTFPGLYLVSMLYAKAVSWLNIKDFCSVSVLRSVNVVFALGNVVLCVMLRRHVAPHDPNALLNALRIAVFPPLFFFTFLFYTDAGATFFVLLMVLLAEKVDSFQAKRNFFMSALVNKICNAILYSGAMAVLFRQTNIIWVVFVAGTVVVRFVELVHSKNMKGVVISNLPSLLLILWPFVVIVAAFVSFLFINGAIVVGKHGSNTLKCFYLIHTCTILFVAMMLGDKSNHEVTFHGAQMLYFTIVAASGFGLRLLTPDHLQLFAVSVHRKCSSLQGFLFIIFLVVATIGVIFHFSPVHKFLLADNRHYTFYVWRKYFLRHNLAKFLPTPCYLFFGWRCWKELGLVMILLDALTSHSWAGQRRSTLWRLVYFLAVCLVLIPSPLVEYVVHKRATLYELVTINFRYLYTLPDRDTIAFLSLSFICTLDAVFAAIWFPFVACARCLHDGKHADAVRFPVSSLQVGGWIHGTLHVVVLTLTSKLITQYIKIPCEHETRVNLQTRLEAEKKSTPAHIAICNAF